MDILRSFHKGFSAVLHFQPHKPQNIMMRLNRSLFLFVFLWLGHNLIAKDYPSSSREIPDELKDWDKLRGLDEAAYAKMKLGDPVLTIAYLRVFRQTIGGDLAVRNIPDYDGAVADIKKRGNEVTPFLIDLMNKYPDTPEEICILATIGAFENIALGPCLEYARKSIRERAQTISAVFASCAASLLFEHGTMEDVALLEWLIMERPYVADSVGRKVANMKVRFGLAPPIPQAEPPAAPLPDNSKKSTPFPANQRANDTPFLFLANPWPKWCALAFIVAGLGFWFATEQRGKK